MSRENMFVKHCMSPNVTMNVSDYECDHLHLSQFDLGLDNFRIDIYIFYFDPSFHPCSVETSSQKYDHGKVKQRQLGILARNNIRLGHKIYMYDTSHEQYFSNSHTAYSIV